MIVKYRLKQVSDMDMTTTFLSNFNIELQSCYQLQSFMASTMIPSCPTHRKIKVLKHMSSLSTTPLLGSC